MTSCAISPNTAKGARNMAHFTMVMEIASSASSTASSGATFWRSTCVAAIPTSRARMTTASMSPWTMEAVGLVGNTPAMISGARPALNGTPASAAAGRAVAADCPRPDSPSPGTSHPASATPIQAAAKVVVRIKPASRSPMARSSPPDCAPVSPPTIDAKISGMSTMDISPRKICPGSASQEPIASARSGASHPVSGPRAIPTARPSAMPSSTCAQSRVRIQARSL